jgi:long-chain-fatty-acid--[acyl-carrier-protein] ligase
MFAKMIMFFFYYLMKIALSFRYKVTIKGLDRVQKTKSGGVLFLPNHPTVFVDPTLVTLAVFKKFPIRPLVVEYHFYNPVVQKFMRLMNGLPMPSFASSSNSLKRKRSEESLNEVIKSLKNGDNFLIYPAGKLKNTSLEDIGANSAAHKIATEVPEANIVLVRIKGLWGSSFSKAIIGKSPPMFATIWEGVKICFKNLLFFTPRREVIIEFEPAGDDLPLKGTRREFNQYLENWYNRPDGLTAQKGPLPGDSLILVSTSMWKNQLPQIKQEAPTQEEKITLSLIPEEIQTKIKKQLAKLADLPFETIKENQELGKDLGLDSLDIAEMVAYLNQEYDISSVPVHEMTTVAKVMAIAAKQVTFKEEVEEEKIKGLKKWLAPRGHERVFLNEGNTIPEVFLNTCQKMGHKVATVDMRSGIMTYSQLKMRVILLALYIRTLPGDHVGILLPASTGAYILILATQLAGKIPLMINWTTGSRHLQSIVELSGAKKILTAWSFIDRIENVDFGGIEENLLMLEEVREQLKLKDKLKAFYLSKCSPKTILKHFGADELTKDNFATLLFTSGTESTPKGVPLTHENLLSNQRSTLEMAEIFSDDVIFGFLPPFHSFGFTYGGLLPILAGLRIGFSPDPTNGKQLVRDFETYRVTIMCSAPTFVKNMLKTAKAAELKTLRLCLTGAEKTPKELFEQMRNIGKEMTLFEGYGITECSPVLTLNAPHKPSKGVGQPIPGVSLLVVHEETHKPLPKGERGLILAKGPNIFSGYLNPGITSPFVTVNGEKWYSTGDLGSLDENDYLTLSGRKKRFIKIGGEMVSLAAIEEAVLDLAVQKNWSTHKEGPLVAVCAQEKNGEKPKIFLFTKYDTTTDEINKSLQAQGFSNLVRVSSVKQVVDIPIMGSGKINYRALEDQFLNVIV